MNRNISNDENKILRSGKAEMDWRILYRKVWISRKLFLMTCGIGAVIGIIIGISIPKEYTAKILIAPENARKSSSLGINALVAMTDVNVNSSTADRDAIYPSLYPIIVNSTPFLIRLFEVKVHEQKDTAAITLATFVMIHFMGIKTGKGGYFKGYLEPVPVLLPINIISELATPISLSFRLFGNILGGMIIMAMVYSLPRWLNFGIPAVLHIYFDVFAGCIQTVIFVMLSMTFIKDKITD